MPTVAISAPTQAIGAGTSFVRHQISGRISTGDIADNVETMPTVYRKGGDYAVATLLATQYGLAAYFYGRDISRVWKVAEALDFGIVGINQGIISTEVAPFGGMKESGNGREGSKYGVEDYLEVKYLCMGV